jgi:type II secretory pathway pseudopilin PulG
MEAAIALAIGSVLALGAGRVLAYTLDTAGRISQKQEAFEQARAALDTLLVNLSLAETICAEIDPQQIMRSLSCTEYNDDTRGLHDYIFTFDPAADISSAKYHRLEFNHNELASHIEQVLLFFDPPSILRVEVYTDGINAPPIVLCASADVRYKKVDLRVR